MTERAASVIRPPSFCLEGIHHELAFTNIRMKFAIENPENKLYVLCVLYGYFQERMNSQASVINWVRNSKDPRNVLLDRVAALLKENFSHYTGVYIYLLEGETLVLHSYRGRPTEHTRIPIGAGICGRAARIKDTVIVDDVNSDAEYIACSLETRSEIVVPIMRDGEVFGEIDIDSAVPAAFSEADRKFLEEVARLLAMHWDAN